jgi:hypothetical protein
MRTTLTTLALCAVLGALAFAGVFFWKKTSIDEHHAHLSSFDWFCEEFQVTDAQRTGIENLHTEYFPECDDHCVHYADTQQTLATINNDPKLDNSPEHEDAAKRLAELEKEADKSFIDFVYKIAAKMEPDQSKRYLQHMKSWLDRASAQ